MTEIDARYSPCTSNATLTETQIYHLLSDIPAEILVQIFLELDLKSLLLGCSMVCRRWRDLIKSNATWKHLSQRDWKEFIVQSAINQSLFERGNTIFTAYASIPNGDGVEKHSEWEIRNIKGSNDENTIEPNQEDIYEYFNKKRKLSMDEEENKRIKVDEDWERFYRGCFEAPKFSGIWKACYGIYGEEKVEVMQKGHWIEAVKITGDIHVPAGKTTFKVRMDRNFESGKGEIHLAETNYQNARWGEAWLVSKGSDAFDVTWPFQTSEAQFICTLYFTRVKDDIVTKSTGE